MKPYLFLCGSAVQGLADLLSGDFSVVAVEAFDASDVQISLADPIPFAVVAVALGGHTGGAKAQAVIGALREHRIPLFVIASTPSELEGCRRCDRAVDDLVSLRMSAKGFWVFCREELVRAHGTQNLPTMHNHFLDQMYQLIQSAKNFQPQ